MKEAIQKWFDQAPWREGIFALGIRHSDQSILTRSRTAAFPAESVATAVQTTADLYHKIERNHFSSGRICLVFKSGMIHVEKRVDGACLVLITAREESALDLAGFDKLFQEFLELKSGD